MPETLRGLIDRVVFHNLDTGYCVLKVQAAGRAEAVTVIGHLPQALAGEQIDAEGTWNNNPKYGLQFNATKLLTAAPHSKEGIARYLSSSMVKHIGPHFAKKIVDHFGEETLKVIDETPARLRDVPGIGRKRIEKIRQTWQENKHIHQILAFLVEYGIGPGRAYKIYKTYGEHAIEMVRANPYRLSDDIWGIGFRTADEMALKLGLPQDAPQRADAAIRHILKDAATSAGHTALPKQILVDETVKLTGMPIEAVEAGIVRQAESKEIIIDSPGDEGFIYRAKLHEDETAVAALMDDILQGPHPLPDVIVENALKWVESRMTIHLSPSQRKAIEKWCKSKVMVITGGPGTGKTTILRAILEIASKKDLKVELAAPTGRAAKRMFESTGREARTLHRLLEFDPKAGGFQRNGGRPLECHLLVVDESSMVDLSLMASVLAAVPPEAGVLFVGDVDQLPSVGPGTVLRDFIDSGAVPVARLTEVHRQAESSFIVKAAHAVNHGEEPLAAPAGKGDFFIVEADEPAAIIEKTLTMIRDRIPDRFGLNPLDDVQILTPMNRTEIGVDSFNQKLQEALNPKRPGSEETDRFGQVFRTGDKVIQTRNNYTKEVFNGDIGRIVLVDPIEQVVRVNIDGREVLYEYADLDELRLAYAVTIHKSQGSEYPAVIVPVHTQHYIMLQRNLLYTAITRGRQLVVLVGSRKAIHLAVTRAETAKRYGRLKERLSGR